MCIPLTPNATAAARLRQAIFLDRDGTINAIVSQPHRGVGDSPTCPEEFELLPGVGEAIRQINRAGFLTVVISNQPGVAKGRFTPFQLAATTRRMIGDLAAFGARLDAVFYCVHHPQALLQKYRSNCECRKPKPGLLLRGARELGIDLRQSYMVGDAMTDVQAGLAAGCRTVWLALSGWRVASAENGAHVRPDLVAADLPDAVDFILREERCPRR